MINPISFEHEGVAIANPFRSACGKFDADPITVYGFKLLKSAGGVSSLAKNLSDGNAIRLSDEFGLGVPSGITDCAITLVDFEGNKIRMHKLRDQLRMPEANAAH
jgi:hypothetical protein